jgi:hypothetical protein
MSAAAMMGEEFNLSKFATCAGYQASEYRSPRITDFRDVRVEFFQVLLWVQCKYECLRQWLMLVDSLDRRYRYVALVVFASPGPVGPRCSTWMPCSAVAGMALAAGCNRSGPVTGRSHMRGFAGRQGGVSGNSSPECLHPAAPICPHIASGTRNTIVPACLVPGSTQSNNPRSASS